MQAVKFFANSETYEKREEIKKAHAIYSKEEKAWYADSQHLHFLKTILPTSTFMMQEFSMAYFRDKLSKTREYDKLAVATAVLQKLESNAAYYTTNGLYKIIGGESFVGASVTAFGHLLTTLHENNLVELSNIKKKRWKIADMQWRDKINGVDFGRSRRTTPRSTPAPAPEPATPVVDNSAVQALEGQLFELLLQHADLKNKVAKLESKAATASSGKITIEVRNKKKILRTVETTVPQSFDQIADLVQARKNILLIGPAGCGKSYVCEIVAETFGLEFSAINCTEDMSASQLTGRNMPNLTTGESVFESTDFLDRFENGGLFLLDELDAANSNVLLVLNTALANGYCNVPNRVENPTAVMHKDFVLVATANTYGRGADRQYVGRNQLDESTIDRFRIGTIEMDYDAGIENAFDYGDDEGNEFVPESGYNDSDPNATRDSTIETIINKGYNLRGTLQYIRHRIEQARTLRRIMSTRFIKEALDMKVQCDWSTKRILEVYFQGWSDDELRRLL